MTRIPCDMAALYRDHGVDTAPHWNKHYRHGWLNTHCPFCGGSRDYHLGYSLTGDYFFCWRCGWKKRETALAAILGTTERQAYAQIVSHKAVRTTPDRAESTISPRSISTYLPKWIVPLAPSHAYYLQSRGFDPDELVEVWGLAASDHTAEANWKWRIIIPIYFEGRLVSYTSRSIGDRPDKYRACPKDTESVHHKQVLYGWDYAAGDTAIVVEGPVDVWRMGPGALGVFGDQISTQQAALLRRFRRVFVLLDGDLAGQVAGERLTWRLGGMGIDAAQIVLPGGRDPGELTAAEALEIRQNLFGWH